MASQSSAVPSTSGSCYLHFLICKFRMDRDILNHILNGVVSVDSYFQQNYNCT
jgi:hypothetical protein